MVAMEPPATLEEEFNDWYDTEHVPERRTVPGFDSATRLVCVSGWPRYLAFYDLREHSVIDEPGYQAISGVHFSPWSKRILARVRGLWRAHGTQIHGDEQLLGQLLRLVMIRFCSISVAREKALVEQLKKLVSEWPGTPRLKVLRNQAGESGQYVALIALSNIQNAVHTDISRLGEFSDKVDLLNEYTPYWSRADLPGFSVP